MISQDPAAGTEVDAGSRVTITVSSGPEQVIGARRGRPVRGRRAAGAQGRGPQAGGALLARPTWRPRTAWCWTSRPTVGEDVDKGDTVVIFVGAFESDDTLAPEETPTP